MSGATMTQLSKLTSHGKQPIPIAKCVPSRTVDLPDRQSAQPRERESIPNAGSTGTGSFDNVRQWLLCPTIYEQPLACKGLRVFMPRCFYAHWATETGISARRLITALRIMIYVMAATGTVPRAGSSNFGQRYSSAKRLCVPIKPITWKSLAAQHENPRWGADRRLAPSAICTFCCSA